MLNSLDDLNSMISKKGGVAQGNRFNVFFTPPNTNILKNPLRTLTNVVSAGGDASNFIHDPREVSILCDTVALPGRNIFTFDHGDIEQQHKYAYSFEDTEVRMTFLLTNDYSIKYLFDDWMSAIIDPEKYQASYKDTYTTDIIIQQLDKNNIPIYSIKLLNAFPIAIDAIVLDNNAENALQKISVSITFDKYVRENLVDTIVSSANTLTNITI